MRRARKRRSRMVGVGENEAVILAFFCGGQSTDKHIRHTPLC